MNNKKELVVELASGKKVNIYVTTPTAKTVQRADRYRAKAWTECIEDGIKTKEELEVIMDERKIWTDSHKDKEKNIILEIQECERQLFLGANASNSNGRRKKVALSIGKDLAIKMRQLRSDLRNLYMKKNMMEQNSAESLADNARFDYIVANSTYYENGENVYNGIEDYNGKSTDEVAFTAAGAIAELMYNYDPRSEEILPENQWLKKYELVDENLSLVNEDKKLVDLDGRRINEFGFYVDSEGKRIDKDGNLLDENGNYEIKVEYQKASTNKKTRKTTAVKAES
jgi:hypothetical protein